MIETMIVRQIERSKREFVGGGVEAKIRERERERVLNSDLGRRPV